MCNLFQPSVAFHIETSHLICSATQHHMKYNTRLKWVKLIVHELLCLLVPDLFLRRNKVEKLVVCRGICYSCSWIFMSFSSWPIFWKKQSWQRNRLFAEVIFATHDFFLLLEKPCRWNTRALQAILIFSL